LTEESEARTWRTYRTSGTDSPGGTGNTDRSSGTNRSLLSLRTGGTDRTLGATWTYLLSVEGLVYSLADGPRRELKTKVSGGSGGGGGATNLDLSLLSGSVENGGSGVGLLSACVLVGEQQDASLVVVVERIIIRVEEIEGEEAVVGEVVQTDRDRDLVCATSLKGDVSPIGGHAEGVVRFPHSDVRVRTHALCSVRRQKNVRWSAGLRLRSGDKRRDLTTTTHPDIQLLSARVGELIRIDDRCRSVDVSDLYR
jgi:hypothetical protein